jgi:hypothetical protein
MLFKIEGEKCYTLVNGNIMENKNEYQYCVIARQTEDKCGSQAKMYKTKYITPFLIQNARFAGSYE